VTESVPIDTDASWLTVVVSEAEWDGEEERVCERAFDRDEVADCAWDGESDDDRRLLGLLVAERASDKLCVFDWDFVTLLSKLREGRLSEVDDDTDTERVLVSVPVSETVIVSCDRDTEMSFVTGVRLNEIS
jgi:hypothetical protein